MTKTDKNQNERDLKTTRAEAQGWDYVGPGSSLEDEKEMKGIRENWSERICGRGDGPRDNPKGLNTIWRKTREHSSLGRRQG